MELCGNYQLTVMTWCLCRLKYKPLNQIIVFPLKEKISVNKFQIT